MSDVEGHWLLDLGNSRAKLARIQAGRVVSKAVYVIAETGWLAALQQALAAAPTSPLWLASSAGVAQRDALLAVLGESGLPARLVVPRDGLGRLTLAYAEPTRLGVDRFLALLAASERDDGPWLLVSVGSALTVDLLGADGRHLGGLIALSPTEHRRALAARVPHLPAQGGRVLAFAQDTEDALASGAMAASAGLVERCQARATAMLGRAPTLLVSGGGSDGLLPHLAVSAIRWPQPVLEGLAGYARASASLPA